MFLDWRKLIKSRLVRRQLGYTVLSVHVLLSFYQMVKVGQTRPLQTPVMTDMNRDVIFTNDPDLLNSPLQRTTRAKSQAVKKHL